jgi:hypothetical protein
VLDYLTEMSLDECVAALEGQARTGSYTSPSVRVTISSIDQDTYSFRIKRTGKNYATNEAKGYLRRWEDTVTHVTGEVQIGVGHQALLVLLFVSIALGCVFTTFNLGTAKANELCLLPVMVLIIIWLAFDAQYKRNSLAELIDKTLSRG